MSDARAAELAVALAAKINGTTVSKAYGTAISAADMYPAASAIAAIEKRVETVERAILELAGSVAAFSPALLIMATVSLAALAAISTAAALPEIECPPAIITDERNN